MRFFELLRLTFVATMLAAIVLTVGGQHQVTAQDQTIQSTVVGEVPTTGGARPGPFSVVPDMPSYRTGEIPVSIEIEKAFVNSQIETIEIKDGIMMDPTGPWIVSWYQESSQLGEIGNVLMAGHLDYWDVGPAVFYNINNLNEGDIIRVTGEDGSLFEYQVQWRENFDTANAPIQDIVGPTDAESLTLITCGGPFDYQTGEYLQRTVVRAVRVAA